MKYWINTGSDWSGPYTVAQLLSRLNTGELSANTPCAPDEPEIYTGRKNPGDGAQPLSVFQAAWEAELSQATNQAPAHKAQKVKTTKICANCGLENVAGRKTCKHCRTILDPADQVTTLHPEPTNQFAMYTAQSASAPVTSLPVSASGYEYLVVPFVVNRKGGLFSLETASAVTVQLQSVINNYVEQGWDYYSTEKINILATPGCLASLFGQRDVFITFDQIIFRRHRQPPELD